MGALAKGSSLPLAKVVEMVEHILLMSKFSSSTSGTGKKTILAKNEGCHGFICV